MVKVININDRGTLTLPRESRDRLGLKSSGQVVIEHTPEGILLRPGVTFPVEIYTGARLDEFKRGEDDLAPDVGAMRTALAKARAKGQAKPKKP